MKGRPIPVSRLAPALLLVLLGALVGATLAGGQARPADPRPHLLVVPESSDGVTALARTDARVVAEYESFSLVEAAGADEERLRDAGAERRDDMRTVETAAGAIDPTTERRSLAAKEGPDREETLALVQFVGPPKEAWLERLRATGARLVTYQAENGYVVHARDDAVERLAALVGSDPAVRAVAVLTAADKLERGDAPAYAVSTVSGDAGADARAEAAGAGAPVGAAGTVDAIRTQYLDLSAAEAAELARDPAVVAAEPYVEPELADERSAQIVAGNLAAPAFTQPSGPGYLAWHQTQFGLAPSFGFTIDVTDEGLDVGSVTPAHPDFYVEGSTGLGSRVSYANDRTAPPPSGPDLDTDAKDCGGHGTNVASIAAGYPSGAGAPQYEDGAAFKHGLGVAPFARLGISKIFQSCSPYDGPDGGTAPDHAFSMQGGATALAKAAQDGGARISNNSWGSGGAGWGAYTSRTREYDALVRDADPVEPGDQPMVEVFAAGNDGDANPGSDNEGYGTIIADGTSKNGITVGAAEGVRPSGTDGCGTTNAGADSARDIVDFSSRGPTNDGRLKPDLVAPGTHVTGARPLHAGYAGHGTCNPIFAGTSLYSLVTGSSQAAPHVSGAAALVRQRYGPSDLNAPSPALTKALLVNTAADLGGGQNGKGDTIAAGPNVDQGWGRVNVGPALDSTEREFRDQRPGDTLETSGESRVVSYAVADDEEPVKVTLAWTDAPGPLAGNAYVNNLDLEVAHGGGTYKGNQFNGQFSRPGGLTDERNNVESIYLPAGTDGPFAVTVRGTSLGGDGVPGDGGDADQDFALVVSNADEAPAPVIVGGGTSVTGGTDGDATLETADAGVDLSQELRNAGDVDATDVDAAFTPYLPATGGGASDYPHLPQGEEEPNDSPYTVTLPADAPCGRSVTGSLNVTAAELSEPQEVPVVVPTGETGAPQNHAASSPQVPVNIPDDNPAGVTSQLFVPDRGRIKDLDVEISDLRHGWVGDLVIDLTSPEGTTVRLVEHPGGPDNGPLKGGGADLQDVIFDDGAPGTIAAAPGPVTGSFRPQADQLSRFNGEGRRGTWTLRLRDRFEGHEGSLLAWRLTSRKAVCNADTTPPETTLNSGPSGVVASRAAAFEFGSLDSDVASFECQLDAAPWEPCDAGTKSYSGLADGAHVFRVRAIDGSDNEDPDPAQTSWTVDATPPTTSISGSPSPVVASGSASFGFTSEAGASFECSLDGAAFQACSSPQSYAGLADGSHTFAVRARDAAGNVEAPGASRTWRVDTVAPTPSVANLGATADATPRLTGLAGTAEGDAPSVTVKLFAGASASGTPVQTHSASVSGGGWTVNLRDLSPGQYTARAEQRDSAGNEGLSSGATFQVVPPAPSFLVGPREEAIAQARAGRLGVLAACAAGCKVTAKVTRRGTTLGRGSATLGAGEARTARIRLTKAGKAAVRGRRAMGADLRVTLTEGTQKLTVTRQLTLRSAGGPRSLAARGLRLWAAALTSAPLDLRLELNGREARRLGLKPKGGRYPLSSKRITAGRSAKAVTLVIARAARDELRRARSVSARLSATAEGTPPAAPRRATLGLSLGR